MRILVAGGAGFIGSQFVRALLAGDYENLQCSQVTVLDALTYAGRRENVEMLAADSRFRFVRGDITDLDLLLREIVGMDLVINFAAESHVDRSIMGPLSFAKANVVGAVSLMEACRRAGAIRMVQVSTDEVYGSIEVGSSSETASLEPNSPYAASKASADLFARSYYQTFGLDIVITRCVNNYGPYQHPEKLIPLFVTNLIGGKRLPLFGDGLNVREWVHVTDHCRGIALVATRGISGEVYNIGGESSLSNVEVTEVILDAFGCKWNEWVEHVPDRLGHDRRYALNDSKIREIGYVPKVTFAEGIVSTIQWYEGNRAWWLPLVG